MRAILKLGLLLVMFCPSAAWATWTCKDGGTGCTNTTIRNCTGVGSCSITIASTTAGSVGTACSDTPGTTGTITSVTGGGTWTVRSASHGSDATAGDVECADNENMSGGTTSITCNFSNSSFNSDCFYFNFTGTLGSQTYDTGNHIDDSTACSSCTAVALSLGTSNNYILVQMAVCNGTCSALSQSYTVSCAGGNCIAYKINVSSAGTTPVWTQSPSDVLAGGAIAIYEASSSTCSNFIPLMGAGCH